MAVYRVVQPVVKQLATDTGEHANLGIEEYGLAVFLYKAKGDDAVTIDAHPGMRVPLHTTAMGKAIMAHRSPEEIEKIVDKRGLTRVNENTITEREALVRGIRIDPRAGRSSLLRVSRARRTECTIRER